MVWGIAHRGGGDRYSDHDSATVVKAILALGGGERFFIWDEGTVRRNVFVIVDTSKGFLLGDEAVATRPGRPPIRGKVEAASPRSVVMGCAAEGSTGCPDHIFEGSQSAIIGKAMRMIRRSISVMMNGRTP
jgi:hypothetical protein